MTSNPSSPGRQNLNATNNSTTPTLQPRKTLPKRLSSLSAKKSPLIHETESPISHLHTLFKSNLQYDPLRCSQGWKVLSSQEWKEGFYLMDIGPKMKEWIKMCLKGVYLYEEMLQSDAIEEAKNDRVASTLRGTHNLLKRTLTQTGGGEDAQQQGDEDPVRSHLLSETVLFRNMSGEAFQNSLRNSSQQPQARVAQRFKNSLDLNGTARFDQEEDEQVEGSSQEDEVSPIPSETSAAVDESKPEQTETNPIIKEISEELIMDPSVVARSAAGTQTTTNHTLPSNEDDSPLANISQINTSKNPFYQIIKEFIEIACIPLQKTKSSEVLLEARKYAELLDILGYLCINAIQWRTIAVRSLRAIRHVFHRCTELVKQQQSLSSLLQQIQQQNTLLSESRITYYVYYTLLLFHKIHLTSAESGMSASSSLERILDPKAMDVLTELLFLLKDFSMLKTGASAITSNQMLMPLMEFIDLTSIIKEENVPLYVHTIIEIVWSSMMQISNFEESLASLEATGDNSPVSRSNAATLTALRKKRTKSALTPLTQRPMSQSFNGFEGSLGRRLSETLAENERQFGGSTPGDQETPDSPRAESESFPPQQPLVSFLTQHSVSMDLTTVSCILSSLLSLLLQLLANATKETDHYLKNDILVICTLFASHTEYKSLFRGVGFIEEICQFFQREVSEEAPPLHQTKRNRTMNVTSSVLLSPGADAMSTTSSTNPAGGANKKYSPPHYRSEMIILMWHLMNSLAYDSNALESMLQEGLLAIILNYVDLTCRDLYCIAKWSDDQLNDLRLQALQSLFFFSELAPQAFCANAGCETLLEFLSHLNGVYMTTEDDDEQEELELMMNRITSVLLNASSTTEGAWELTEKRGFSFLFELAVNQDDPVSNDVASFIQRRNDCFEILTQICRQHPAENQPVFFESGGVYKVLTLLNQYNTHNGVCSSMMTDQQARDFVFQMVNCLWACVIGYSDSEMSFNRESGMFVLLDVLDLNVDFIKYSALGFIGDLVSRPEARQHLSQWVSSTTKKTAVETLVQMWISENAVLTSDSSSSDVSSEVESKFGCKRSDLDFKLKIHTVLAPLEFKDHHPRKSLSHHDAIVLQEIASFGDMLNNRAWAAIASELDSEGVRPITPDAGVLRERSKLLVKLEDSLQQKKISIQAKVSQSEQRKQQEFFEYIKTLVLDQEQEKVLNAKKVSILERKRLKDKLIRQARGE